MSYLLIGSVGSNRNPENETALEAVNAFAADLAARFSPTVGCTRSWDNPDPTLFRVIIDNMMNLEVLFASYARTGNKTLVDIAVSHADRTLLYHVRPNGSSFHVVEYNATTGEVIGRITAQGYSDNSTWSRGQAWGIYGFANSTFQDLLLWGGLGNFLNSVCAYQKHELPGDLTQDGDLLPG